MYRIFADETLFSDSRVDELMLINPIVKLEANKAGTFTFTVPANHPFYDKIHERKTLITIYKDSETNPFFSGVVVCYEKDFFNQRLVTCEGDLTYLNDSILRPNKYHDETANTLLRKYINEHNSQVEAHKQFTVGAVTVHDSNDSISCYTNYESTMSEINSDLIDDIGGYLRIRYENGVKYLDYYADAPNTSTQVIMLGENLLDFKSNLDSLEIATRVIPLGEILEENSIPGLDERLTIKSVNDGLDYIESPDAVEAYGNITSVVEFDNVSEPNNLKRKGQQYLNEIQFANLSIEANVIDLHYDDETIEPFKMLDKIRVVSKMHGLDSYFILTGMELNLNNPENDTFTLGKTEKISLTARNKQANDELLKRIESFQKTDILDAAKDNASELIKTAQNGFISLLMDEAGNPKELLIMDAKDRSTATKVWRWNVNGLGYSNTGYSGSYGLALTMDGSIVADFITAGTMHADRIKGGSLVLGGSNNENGQLYLKDSSGNVLILMNKDGLTMSDSVRISANNIYGGRLILGGNGAYADIQVLDENGNQTGIWTKDGFFSIRGKIAGWNLTDNALWKGRDSIAKPDGKYLGVDGFSISDYFVVDSNGLWQKSPNFRAKQYQNLVRLETSNITYGYQTTGYVRIYYINVPENTWSSFRINTMARINAPNASFTQNRGYTKSFNTGILFDSYDSPDANRLYYDSQLQTNVRCTEINLESLKMKGSGSVYDQDMGQITYNPNTDIEKWYLTSIEYNNSGQQLQLYKVEININGIITTYNGKMVCREKGTLFSTRTNEFTTENVAVTNNGIDLYDNTSIKCYESSNEGNEYYTTEKVYEITKDKINHKKTYNNTGSYGKSIYVDSNGNFYASSSSQRYKEDISYNTAMFDCNELYKLPVAVFRYKEEFGGGNMQIGLIAEDVANIFPVCAVYDENGNVESWDERNMIPAMLQLIQEQNARLEKLERMLEDGKY